MAARPRCWSTPRRSACSPGGRRPSCGPPPGGWRLRRRRRSAAAARRGRCGSAGTTRRFAWPSPRTAAATDGGPLAERFACSLGCLNCGKWVSPATTHPGAPQLSDTRGKIRHFSAGAVGGEARHSCPGYPALALGVGAQHHGGPAHRTGQLGRVAAGHLPDCRPGRRWRGLGLGHILGAQRGHTPSRCSSVMAPLPTTHYPWPLSARTAHLPKPCLPSQCLLLRGSRLKPHQRCPPAGQCCKTRFIFFRQWYCLAWDA